MTDLGRSDVIAALDDRGPFRAGERTGTNLFERWGLDSGRWLWLLVLNLALGAAIEELRYTTADIGSLDFWAVRWGQVSLSLPVAWVGKSAPHLNYHALYVLNAPIWALLVEVLMARFIAKRHGQKTP